MSDASYPILAASGIASIHNIHESRSTQEHKLGTRAFTDDGRVFYYGQASSSTAIVGQLYVAREIVANHENLATTTGSLAVGSREIAVGAITPGATALTANQYKDGYLAVTDGGGQGYMYRIKNHDAFTASTADGAVSLYDAIAVASDANTTVSFIYNLYSQPQISNTDQADVVVGVPAHTIADSEYGWFQTWGQCAVLCDEAVAAVGQAVVTGTGTAGAVEEDDTATTVSQEPLVGYNISPLVDTEYQVIDLRIRP